MLCPLYVKAAGNPQSIVMVSSKPLNYNITVGHVSVTSVSRDTHAFVPLVPFISLQSLLFDFLQLLPLELFIFQSYPFCPLTNV